MGLQPVLAAAAIVYEGPQFDVIKRIAESHQDHGLLDSVSDAEIDGGKRGVEIFSLLFALHPPFLVLKKEFRFGVLYVNFQHSISEQHRHTQYNIAIVL